MAKPYILLTAACGLLALSGCETTGDPSTGGIFWSETKAKQRLYEREQTLDEIEGDTRRVNRSNRRLEGVEARKRRALYD